MKEIFESFLFRQKRAFAILKAFFGRNLSRSKSKVEKNKTRSSKRFFQGKKKLSEDEE